MDKYPQNFNEWKKSHKIREKKASGRSVFVSENSFLNFSPKFSCKTYNTKKKIYPDGSCNYYYSPTDLYGRSVWQYSKEYHKSVFQVYYESCQVRDQIFDLQFKRYQLEKEIQVYWKSVDNYLIACQQWKDFDKQLDRDFIYMNFLDITQEERRFLNSLDNSIRHDNLKRARDSIYDLVYSNDWSYFFTGTLSQDNIDRYDIDIIRSKLNKWLSHLQERYNCSYLIIFERHKKGGIHIHGLLRESPFKPLRLVDSGTRSFYGFKRPIKESTANKYGLDWSKGQMVYNLLTWKFGFSTAIKCYGDRGALAHYITKYVTKDNEKIMGRYYWHSRDLKKPTISYCNTELDKLRLPIYHGWRFQFVPSASESRQIYQYTEFSDI